MSGRPVALAVLLVAVSALPAKGHEVSVADVERFWRRG